VPTPLGIRHAPLATLKRNHSMESIDVVMNTVNYAAKLQSVNSLPDELAQCFRAESLHSFIATSLHAFLLAETLSRVEVIVRLSVSAGLDEQVPFVRIERDIDIVTSGVPSEFLTGSSTHQFAAQTLPVRLLGRGQFRLDRVHPRVQACLAMRVFDTNGFHGIVASLAHEMNHAFGQVQFKQDTSRPAQTRDI
jgi:hypothetical protein